MTENRKEWPKSSLSYSSRIHIFYLPLSITAYSCKNSIVKDKIFVSKYYISAGPGDHSVILLEETKSSNNNSSHYEIIEFLEYVTKNYIHFNFQNLYWSFTKIQK